MPHLSYIMACRGGAPDTPISKPPPWLHVCVFMVRPIPETPKPPSLPGLPAHLLQVIHGVHGVEGAFHAAMPAATASTSRGCGRYLYSSLLLLCCCCCCCCLCPCCRLSKWPLLLLVCLGGRHGPSLPLCPLVHRAVGRHAVEVLQGQVVGDVAPAHGCWLHGPASRWGAGSQGCFSSSCWLHGSAGRWQ